MRPVTSSPFSPPRASDAVFVVDDGVGLDTGCTYRSGGPLRIRLPILRVLSGADRASLRASGLLPDKVRIEFPAYDVDSGATVTGVQPERDRVSVNGNVVPGEFITGLNNTWVMQRFDIPVEWLRFGSEGSTATPGDNEIRIDIDTANPTQEAWCTAIDWVSVTAEFPLPWVGAHGILSSNNIWNSLWVPSLRNLGISAVPGPNMGNLDSIQNNARKISTEIEAAKQRFGVSRVNVVAHSKGGLDSRHLINNDDSVSCLVQLGTPNAGSPLADFVQRSAYRGASNVFGLPGVVVLTGINLFAAPAGYQLTTPYMTLYNRWGSVRNPNTDYVSIAGDYTPGNLLNDTKNAFTSFIVGRPSDAIVPVSSAHALSYAQKFTTASAFPSRLADHYSLHQNPAVFNIALPFVQACGRRGVNANNLARAAERSEDLADAAGERNVSLPGTIQSIQSVGGVIGPSQSIEQALIVDSGASVSFVLIDGAGSLDLEFTDPSNVVYTPATLVGNPAVNRVEDGLFGGFIEVVSFTSPFPIGTWKVRVVSKASTPGNTQYNVGALIDQSPVSFTSSVLDLSVPTGTPVRLRGTLTMGGAPLTGATVSVRVVQPDGSSATSVTLLDNGVAPDTAANDGVYNGVFSSTTQFGSYPSIFTAQGTAGGAPFAREVLDFANVSSNSSTIRTAGFSDFGRDTDGNSLFNHLVVRIPLNIAGPGNYRVSATLRDSASNTLEASFSGTLSVANTTVDLSFDGASIGVRGVNGPYVVTSVRLAEENLGFVIPIQESISPHTTGAYNASQFEGGGFSLTGAGSAIGVDTNANTKFDILRVDLGVRIASPGLYQWSGRLRDRTGREISLANGSGSLAVGLTSIRLDFSGATIGANGVDGPYDVSDVLVFLGTLSATGANALRTQAFRASDFEGFVGVQGPPRISGIVQSVATGSPTRVTVDLRNTGTGPARSIFITQAVLRVLAGPPSPLPTISSPNLPIFVGDVAVGASRSVDINVNVPSGVTRLSVNLQGTVIDGAGNTASFSSALAVNIR